MAPHPLILPERRPCRRLLTAQLPGLIAARRKAATLHDAAQRRHAAGNRGEHPIAIAGVRQGRKQFLRIRMQRLFKQFFAAGLLNDLPRVHHGDAMRHLCNHAKIVRDQQHRHARLILRVAQQLQHLRLYRHIQRRGRLVGHQQGGLPCQRHRDHHALLHAA